MRRGTGRHRPARPVGASRVLLALFLRGLCGAAGFALVIGRGGQWQATPVEVGRAVEAGSCQKKDLAKKGSLPEAVRQTARSRFLHVRQVVPIEGDPVLAGGFLHEQKGLPVVVKGNNHAAAAGLFLRKKPELFPA